MSVNYPLDPYPMNDTQYWAYPAGQLTPVSSVELKNLEELRLAIFIFSSCNRKLRNSVFSVEKYPYVYGRYFLEI